MMSPTCSNASDAAINIATASVTATITDDDSAAASIDAHLSVTTNGNEAGPVAIVYQVTLAQTNNTGSDITFSISPTGGTATAGADYTNFSVNTVTILDGATSGNINVPVNDDTLFENTETIVATISNPSDGAVVVNTASATANITDSDNTPGSIDANLAVSTDGDETGPVSIVYTVTIAKTNNTGSSIDFAIDPTSGTATAGSDYTDFTAGTISVADGASTGTLTVAVSDDTLFENDETAEATISVASDPAINIATGSATATITDNDNAAGSIDSVVASTVDGDETGNVDVEYEVTISKVNNTHAPITLDVLVTNGTATSGDDYAALLPGTVTIPDNSDTGTYVISGVVDDSLFENDETIEITTSNPSDPAINIATASATGTIIDNDNAAGSIDADLSVTTDGDETGPVSIVYTVTLANTNNTHGDITVDIDPSAGTAIAGSDYTDFAGQQVTIADGSSTGTLTVDVTDDSLFENTETVEATISNASDAAININTASDTADIVDNDNAAASIDAVLTASTNGDEEGTVSAVFTVTLANANNTGSPITFDIEQSGGTADVGDDYVDFTGQITVANGSDTGTVSVTIVDDSLSENTETIEATISNPSDPAINIAISTATADLIDNDGFALIEPVYSLWNGFLGQLNIISLANKASVVSNVKATLFDIDGNSLGVQNIALQPGAEFDVIVNDLPGFTEDLYGAVKIEFDQPIEGQSVIARTKASNASNYDFMILNALSNKITGASYALFNTYQPSQNPDDQDNHVFNFAQIVNLATSTKTFRVETIDEAGTVLRTRNVIIPASGRRDVDAGHENPGPNNVGMIVVTPLDSLGDPDSSVEYLAQVATYSPNSSGGFDFAFSEEFRNGSTEMQFSNGSSGGGAENWAAIANVSSFSETVNLRVISNAGVEVINQDVSLAAFSQVHIKISDLLPDGQSGIIMTTPQTGKPVISNSRSYFYADNGSITTANLDEGRSVQRGTLHATYNTFIGNFNWLRIFNVGSSNATVNVEVLGLDGSSLGNADVTVNAATGIDLEVSNSLGITVPSDSYGLVRLTSNDNPSLISHILRLKLESGASGIVDVAKPIPVR